MKRFKRLIAQLIFWLVVWGIMWMEKDLAFHFLQTHWPAFLLQIVLITIVIFYFAPGFLFKKKYTSFILLSIMAIGLSASLSSYLEQPPSLRGTNFPQMGPRPSFGRRSGPPSKILINSLLMALSYGFTAFFEIFFFVQKKDEELMRNKNEALQTELKLLKSQINPHFLFNALNNIYALSVTNSEKTQESIGYLSNMLRYVLYECERPMVSLQKEVEYIKNYILLFSLKSSKSMPIHTQFDLTNHGIHIAPMLLIPFIENAFKHSNIEKNPEGFIHITLQTTTDKIHFEIENTYPQTSIQKDEVGGIGLENVKKRLTIVYPKQHLLTIHKNSTTFSVVLDLEI